MLEQGTEKLLPQWGRWQPEGLTVGAPPPPASLVPLPLKGRSEA